jgi:hypothetical protein
MNGADPGTQFLILQGLVALGMIGAGIKWVVPLIMERGKTKRRSEVRIEASGSTIAFQRETIDRYVKRVRELEDTVAVLEAKLRERPDE